MQGLLARNRDLVRQLQEERALRARDQDRLRELEQAKRPTASNSSLPPSANPIGARPPVVKKPTGKKPGGQVGRKGKARRLVDVEQVHRIVRYRPEVCRHCQAVMDPAAEGTVVGRHQVAELPRVAVELTEHQSLACTCGKCGQRTEGRIPEQIRASVAGPRLTGAIGLLGAAVKGSKRALALVLKEVLGCELSLGSVSNRERELSAALHGPYEQLVAKVKQSPVKYADETGWKLKGKTRWLFVAAAAGAVVFRIESSRTFAAFLRLLDGEALGVFCTDRFGIYDQLDLERRGLCWAHLRRDFVAVIERGGAGLKLGEAMLKVADRVFELWRECLEGRLGREDLRHAVEKLSKRMRRLLRRGKESGLKRTAGLCRRLLDRESALWRFAWVEGLEPSNNLAERMLRGAVIWRKKSFGSQSLGGCEYVQRMLSVVETLRLRAQSVLDYLEKAVAAHRCGTAAPGLVAVV